jgi:hypothetical protein
MRGVLIFLGLLLVLAGGAVAAARYVPVDLAPYLSTVPGALDFLKSQMALYAGGGAAGFGLLLTIVAMATGGSKKSRAPKPAPAPRKAPGKAAGKAAEAKAAARAPDPSPSPPPQPRPAPAAPAAQPKPQLQAVAATPRPTPASHPSAAKPQASSQPPPVSHPLASHPQASDPGPTWTQDPRLLNRKRVSDLVTLNDAIKAFHKKHGAYPRADGLKGYLERGKAWIPGLSPDFIAELPRDPARSDDPSGPQYLYASNGTDYKLLAHSVALAGGTNVEVLGVRIDASRNPTWEKASFGFWTDGYASL